MSTLELTWRNGGKKGPCGLPCPHGAYLHQGRLNPCLTDEVLCPRMAERAPPVGEVGVCLNLGTGDWCLIREAKRGPSMMLRTFKRVGFQKFERVQPSDLVKAGSTSAAPVPIARECRLMAESVEGLLQRLFDRAPDGMVVMRASDGLIVLVNEAFGRLLGLPVEGIVGHNSAEFGLWPAPAQRGEVQRSVLAEGARLAVESRLSTRDGGLREVEISADIVEIDGVDHAFAITRDITSRKSAERALRASEERFRSLLAGSRDPILVTDAAGVLTYCSPGVEYLLGYKAEDLVGTRELDLFHPEDLGVREAIVSRLVRAGAPGAATEMRMRHREGTWRWVETIEVNRLDTPAVGGIVTNVHDITVRKDTEQTQAFLALHDPLTGLPNRRLVDDRLDLALARGTRTGGSVAVLYCDLDRFKEVNDQGGHVAGDELLRQIASRLRSVMRPGDTVARVGGDEFVIVCADLQTAAEAGQIAGRVAHAAAGPIRLAAGPPIEVTISIGIATASGRQLAEIEPGSLLRNADAAMYRAKDRGRNRWETFDTAMQEQINQRLELETQLRQALARGELAVYYQPVVRLTDAAIVGAEALLRWQHPTRGLLTPAHFLDVAEDSGLIISIGEWVLSEAIQQLSRWQSGPADPMWVSVNVSGRQLRDRGLGQALTRLLATTTLGTGSLRLELTESMLIEHGPVAAADLGEVVDLGVPVGIDDFGTGYSSLTYLQQLPISFLKIDTSFVADLHPSIHPAGYHDRPALTEAIVQLSHTLDIEAVAEGIETPAQAQALTGFGCTYGQGYLYSVPLPAEAMTSLIGLS